MRIRLLITPVVFSLLGCSSPSAPEARDVPSDAAAIVGEDFRDAIEGMRHFSGYEDRARRVIRDRETWARVWLRATSGAPPRPLPEVDFDKRMIVFAAMGSQRSTGHRIEIIQLSRLGEDLYVVVKETSPGLSCAFAWAMTAPVTAALVPRSSGAVHFVERTAVADCR